MPVVTGFYAGILGLMAIVLGFQAGRLRGARNISIGDGGDPELLLAMRRHANFVEFVPLALVLIALVEMNGAPKLAIHALGAGLVVFRASHAVGINAESAGGAGRAIGAAGNSGVVGGSAGAR